MLLIAIGVLFALVSGILVFRTVAEANAARPEEQKTIYFAVDTIPERTRITDAMIVEKKVNVSAAPVGAIESKSSIVDHLTVTPVFKDSPFYPSAIVTSTKESNVASAAIERGKVLVAINFSGATNILTAGAIRKGDTVDLLVKVPGPNGTVIATTMQNLKVYEIGTVEKPKAGTDAAPASAGVSNFIFQVTPEEALELKYLETLSPDLVLRSSLDQREPPRQRPLIDMEFLANKYGLPLAKTGPAPGGATGAPPAAPKPGAQSTAPPAPTPAPGAPAAKP
jgi:Flp pilus assembly protein CpaB